MEKEMICQDKEAWLNRYLDGEMDAEETGAFEEHLAGCPACRHELAEMRALFAALGGLADAPPDAAFAGDVMAGLPRRRMPAAARQLVALQAVASVVLLALAYPTLAAGYEWVGTWFAPGRLGMLFEEMAAALADAWQQALSGLPAVEITRPRGLGLAWPQATLLALALLAIWAVCNRLLLSEKVERRGGTT